MDAAGAQTRSGGTLCVKYCVDSIIPGQESAFRCISKNHWSGGELSSGFEDKQLASDLTMGGGKSHG